MTLQNEYLALRKRTNQVSDYLPFFYKYYMQKAKTPLGFNEFQSIMMMGDISRVVSNLDSEYGVVVLLDRNGREMMVL
jgi:hypothetical protein